MLFTTATFTLTQKALLGFETELKEWMTDSVYKSYPSLLTRLDALLAQIKDV